MHVAKAVSEGATSVSGRNPGAQGNAAARLPGPRVNVANANVTDDRLGRSPGTSPAASRSAKPPSSDEVTGAHDRAPGDPTSVPALLQAFLLDDLERAYALLDSGTVGVETRSRRQGIRHRHGMSPSRDEHEEF